MLVRSIRENNALHAVLLGGNPGFSPEAAQCVNQTTSRAPLRLNLMPKGVSMLLRRWMQLQATEMTGGSTSANTSISGLPIRSSRELQRDFRQSVPDLLNVSESRNTDLSSWDADSSKLSHQMADQWVRSSEREREREGSYGHSNGIADEGRGVRSSGDLAYRQENQDSLFGHIPPTREAWRGAAPKDSAGNSFKIYLNPQSQTPMSAFLPMSATPTTPYRAVAGGDISPRYAPSDDCHPYVTKSFVDSRAASEAAQNTPNSYYRMKSSAQGGNADRNRSRSPGHAPPVPSDWASSSAKGTLDQQLRQLVGTSLGRVGGDSAQRVRSRSAQRSSSPSYMARRQANACTRLSQGIASAERLVPSIRARQSPQRRDRRNGDHHHQHQESSERDTDSCRRSMSAMRERYARSPNYRSDGSAASSAPRPSRPSTSSPYCESPLSKNSGDRGFKKKKKSKKSSREKGGDKEIAREQDKQSVIHQQALDGVILRFADSVKEINRSLGTVSNQLRDVSCSLSASAQERASSSSESGSPALKAVFASPGHSATSPVRAKAIVSPKTEISPVRKPSPVKSPVPLHAMINKKFEKEASSPEEGHGGDALGQTFGRTRGSLMHHSGAWRGENLLSEHTHDHEKEPSPDRAHTHSAPISLLSSFMNSQKKAPNHPVKTLSPEKTGGHKHGHSHAHSHGHSNSPVSTYHDRWSARIMSTSTSTPTISSNSNHVDRGRADNGVKKSPTHESVEMSDADMATLIRERLRKKLKSVLRPVPSPSSASATPLSP